MPTPPVPAATMAVADIIWGFEKWKERTKHVVAPFSPDATPEQTKLTEKELEAIKALAHRIHGAGDYTARIKAFREDNDNDKAGKAAWLKWFQRVHGSWKVMKDIEEALNSLGRHPRLMVFGKDGKATVEIPKIKHAGVLEHKAELAYMLFGEDAFVNPDDTLSLVKPDLLDFIGTLLAYMWHQTQKTVKSQFKRLEKGKQEARIEYEKLNNVEADQDLTADDLLPWLRKVDKLVRLAAGFRDSFSEESLRQQLDSMSEMYKVITGEVAPHLMEGLSPNLRDALGKMASKVEAQRMAEQLAERLELEKTESDISNISNVEFDFDPLPAEEWSEGVEHLHGKTPGDLYRYMGLKEQTIPYFRKKIHSESESKLSNKLGELETSTMSTEGFTLKWHQLVGVFRMLERGKASEPILLMDDVGLGKTVQVLALFAMLAYYREYFEKYQEYPGSWGQKGPWKDYNGVEKADGLPPYPFLILAPPTLVEQVALECFRFLEPGSFDIIKITGAMGKHESVWSEADKRAEIPAHMRIYIASTTAVQSESAHIHVLWGHKKPKVHSRAVRVQCKTVFGRRYLGVAIDEAHGFRNANKLYGAVRMLRDRTDILVAMTATPVQTRPSDLWHIGKAIGLPGFDDSNDHELESMNKDIARSKREDRKEMRSTSEDTLYQELSSFLVGEGQQNVEMNTRAVTDAWIKRIRKKYEGSVIRRTVNSKDNEGKSITGLEAYEEHLCVLEMYQHEYDAIEALAKRTTDSETFVRRFASENFYLDIRKTLLHPWCVEDSKGKKDSENKSSRTYQMYESARSAKLDSLVEILQHHLANDGAPGITPTRHTEQALSLLQPQPQRQQQQQIQASPSPPDKIIVYSFFPSSFGLIKMVLEANGIEALAMHGSMSQKKRVELLREFRECDRGGARVLLISNVGSVGLNIACANIVIIVDVLWSVLSEQQLIGRVWRYPQKKRVHIYRLIGARSPDIFLNNISYSKGFIQDSFARIGDNLKEALQVGEKEDLAEYVDLSDNVDGEEPGDKVKGKGKGKAKTTETKTKKVAPRARYKGKAKVASETEPAPADTTTGTAAGSNTAPPIVPAPILPTSVLDLEKCISFFYASQYGILDEMDDEEDNRRNDLLFMQAPTVQEILEFLRLELRRSYQHLNAIGCKFPNGGPDCVQMTKEAEMRRDELTDWIRKYERAETTPANPVVTVDMDLEVDVDMMGVEQADWAELPESPLTSLTDFQSDHQSESMVSGDVDADESPAYSPAYSATTSSKRSREPSDENNDDIEASEVQVSETSNQESGHQGKTSRQSAYKRANVSKRSTPATDSQFLKPKTAASGSSKARKDKSMPSFADDAAQSFGDMRLGWDGREGGSGKGSDSSRQSSRKASSHRRSRQ